MSKYYFISYSTADAQDFAHWLYDGLSGPPNNIPAWLDKHFLQPGPAWDEGLVDAIRNCRAMVFVMTPDSVDEYSVCKNEWIAALKYKKQVLPLRLHEEAELPFQLNDLNYLDFVADHQAALTRLVERIERMNSPVGQLEEQQRLLSLARRDLRRAATEAAQARIEDDIQEYKRQIENLQQLIEDPEEVARRTRENIDRGIERERRPAKPATGKGSSRFINPPPGVAPNYFQDRFVETKLVVDFLSDESKRLITIVGRGGVGKTALICRLLKTLENGLLPDDEGEFEIDGVVYLTAGGSHPVSMANIFNDLCKLLPDDKSQELADLFKEPSATTQVKMAALLEAFPAGKNVLVLDNFETFIDPATGKLRDNDTRECLAALLTLPTHGVKVVITTRVAPVDLALIAPGVQSRIDLDEGLPEPFAENILREMDLDGKLGLRDASAELLGEARVRTRGFPRALEALYAILSTDRNTSLKELLVETEKLLPENVVEALVGEAFSRLDRNSQMVMQALAVYNRPVPPVAVDFMLAPFLPGVDSAPTLGRLLNMQFIRKEEGRYYLHPIDNAYALSRIKPAPDPASSEKEFTLRSLQQLGAEYFRQARKPRADWKTIEDLAPQMAEFDLRCQYGDYETAYRVVAEIYFNYLLIWGYYREIVDMFTRLKGKLTENPVRYSCLNALGMGQENLGEYLVAIENYEQAIAWADEAGDRSSEVVYLSNLAICYVRLGQTRKAMQCNQRGLELLGPHGYPGYKISHMNNLANRYADLGDNQAALRQFDSALSITQLAGNRYAEAVNFESVGHVLVALGQWDEADQSYRRSLEVADEIGSVQVKHYAHAGLSLTALLRGDIEVAEASAARAAQFSVPENNHLILVLQGIIQLRKGAPETARAFFDDAISRCERMLDFTAQNFGAIDAKALAACGLALCDESISTDKAIELFLSARAINRDAGVIARITTLFNELAKAPGGARLEPVRSAAAFTGN